MYKTKRRNSFIFKHETTSSEKKRIQIHRIDRTYSARISNDTTNNILITRVLSTVVDRAFREGGARGGKGGEDGETLE